MASVIKIALHEIIKRATIENSKVMKEMVNKLQSNFTYLSRKFQELPI